MNINNIISVVTIVLNNEDIIADFIQEVSELLKQNYKHYELVLLDNGSTDRSLDQASSAAKLDKHIRIICLSKNYEDEIAYTAALENAIGDYVILIDCVSDPPELIPAMVEKCASGKDCVLAEYVGKPVEPLWYRVAMYFYYRLFAVVATSDVKITFSNYICFSRSMVEAIVKVKDRVRWIKITTIEVGFIRDTIPYEHMRRPKARSGRRFLKRLFFRLEVLFSGSTYLLQATNLLSFGIAFLSFMYIVYAFGVYFLKPDVAEGWASTSVAFATFFGFMFLVLGILGQYVSIVHKETKKGPLYHIAREISSGELYDLFKEKNIE